MTPEEKVIAGLSLAREGFNDLRDERLELAARLNRNRAATAAGEEAALGLRYEALRIRQDRSLSGALPARQRLRDGVQVSAPSIEAETAASLALYVPTGSTRAALPPRRVGLLGRIFGALT